MVSKSVSLNTNDQLSEIIDMVGKKKSRKNSTKRKSRKKSKKPKKLNKKRSKIQSKKKRNIRNIRNKRDYGAKVFKEDEENYPSGAPRYELINVPTGVQNGMKFITGTSAGPMVVTCPPGACPGTPIRIPIPDRNDLPPPPIEDECNDEDNGSMMVKVPRGVYPGMQFPFDTPKGRVNVICPPGVGPGSMLQIQIPDNEPVNIPETIPEINSKDSTKTSSKDSTKTTSKDFSETMSETMSETISDILPFTMKKGSKKKFLLEVTAL